MCVCQVSGATLNLQSVVSAVQRTLERLSRTKQEVDELRRQHQVQIQEQQELCRKYRERLLKVLTKSYLLLLDENCKKTVVEHVHVHVL